MSDTTPSSRPPGGQAFDPTSITFAVVLVTPELAAEWLATRNTHNRKIRTQRVALLAEDMTRGSWVFDAMPLRFATDDTLLDGQHRLAAVVRSGLPQHFLVVSGLNVLYFETRQRQRALTLGPDEPTPTVAPMVRRRRKNR